jgi:glycosyltransferase involved in cell wall biosynthesis
MTGTDVQNEPIVSIIIPCFNYGQFIGDSLGSLMAQSYPYWECWVIDDGSTDDTAGRVKQISRLDPRIKYRLQPNQGQAIARNTGLRFSKGQFIQFLDADDLIQPEKIASQLHFLNLNPKVDIVYGEVRYFTQSPEAGLFLNRWDQPQLSWMPKISGKGYPLIKALAAQNIFELGCALFRRTAINTIGWFNSDFHGVEDYDYCFRAASKELQFAYLDSPDSFCLMRNHPGSFSKRLNHMYRKELLMRRQMRTTLIRMKAPEITRINRLNYNRRLKRLQDLMIDQTLKDAKPPINFDELEWIFEMSNLTQNAYFFPRILKSLLKRALTR